MIEVWAVVASDDELVTLAYWNKKPDDIPSLIKDFDEDLPEGAPHRIVHLVEAGTIEPEVAAVIRAAADDHLRNDSPPGGRRWGEYQADKVLTETLSKLTPAQRKACRLHLKSHDK